MQTAKIMTGKEGTGQRTGGKGKEKYIEMGGRGIRSRRERWRKKGKRDRKQSKGKERQGEGAGQRDGRGKNPAGESWRN